MVVRKPVKKAKGSRTGAASVGTSGKRELPTITMEELADFNESHNILIYGDSGVGKTPLVGMAPHAILLGTEKGSISAKRFGSKANLIKAPTWEHIEAALDYVDKLQKTDKRREWMIVDSLTKMQVLHLRWILRMANEDNDARDLDVPAIQDHQKWQNMFKRFVDRIIDMDINVIFITTAMHREDPEGDDIVMPDLLGKDYAIASYVCAQMDGVYCLKAVENKKTGEPLWKLLTKTKPPYFAKDRYNAHETVVWDPFMPEIIAAIERSAAQENKARPRLNAAPDTEDDDWDDDGEPELAAKPLKGETGTRTQGKRSKGRTDQPSDPEDDDIDLEDDDDDGEDSQEAHNAAVTRRRAKSAGSLGLTKFRDDGEEDDDDDDDFGQSLIPVTNRRAAREDTQTKALRTASERKAAREAKVADRRGKRTATVEADEDPDPADWFDPDDELQSGYSDDFIEER